MTDLLHYHNLDIIITCYLSYIIKFMYKAMKKLNTYSKVLVSTIFLILAFLIACGSNISIMSVDALKQKVDNGSKVVIVDVRPKENFDEYHIKDSVSIPKIQIIAGIWKPPKNSDREFVLY